MEGIFLDIDVAVCRCREIHRIATVGAAARADCDFGKNALQMLSCMISYYLILCYAMFILQSLYTSNLLKPYTP